MLISLLLCASTWHMAVKGHMDIVECLVKSEAHINFKDNKVYIYICNIVGSKICVVRVVVKQMSNFTVLCTLAHNNVANFRSSENAISSQKTTL